MVIGRQMHFSRRRPNQPAMDRQYCVRGWYSYLWSEDPPGNEVAPSFEVAGPRHQASLLTYNRLTNAIGLSSRPRFVDDIADLETPGYVSADLRLSYQFANGLEIALVGQDLLEESHAEYVSELARMNSEVQRQLYAEITWAL